MTSRQAGLATGIAVVCAIVGLLALGYAGSLSAPFLFDDIANILHNGSIRWVELSWAQLQRVSLVWPNPRPVANLSFALSYWGAGGYEVEAFRAANIAIHGLNGLWIYAIGVGLLRRLGGCDAPAARAGAAVAALVFVAHPLQTQSVIYVVQRMNSLASFFYLVAFWCYVRGREARRPGGWWFGCAVSGLLALGSKEHAVSLPVVLWLYEWLAYRGASGDFVRRSAPWVAAGAVCGLVAVYFTWDPFADYARKPFTMGERVLTQLRVLWFYVGLITWPLPERLSLMHSVETSRGLLAPWSTLFAALAWAAVAVAAWRARVRFPLLSFALAWFVATLAVESSILPLEMVYEHRTYLPLAGFCWGLGYGAARGWRRNRAALAILGLCVVLALGAATQLRSRVWLDKEGLWRDAVEKSGNPMAHNNLGRLLAARGLGDEAAAHYEQAVAGNPFFPPAHRNLGVARLRAGRREEARASLQRALELGGKDSEASRVLGEMALGDRNYAAAIDYLQQSFEARPDAAVADLLGRVAGQLGQPERARDYFALALEVRPGDPAATLHLGLALVELGDVEAARAQLERANALRPSVRGHRALAGLAWQRGDRAGVVYDLSAARRLAPEDVEVAWRLAWWHAAAGAAPPDLAAAEVLLSAAPRGTESWRLLSAVIEHNRSRASAPGEALQWSSPADFAARLDEELAGPRQIVLARPPPSLRALGRKRAGETE